MNKADSVVTFLKVSHVINFAQDEFENDADGHMTNCTKNNFK